MACSFVTRPIPGPLCRYCKPLSSYLRANSTPISTVFPLLLAWLTLKSSALPAFSLRRGSLFPKDLSPRRYHPLPRTGVKKHTQLPAVETSGTELWNLRPPLPAFIAAPQQIRLDFTSLPSFFLKRRLKTGFQMALGFVF